MGFSLIFNVLSLKKSLAHKIFYIKRSSISVFI